MPRERDRAGSGIVPRPPQIRLSTPQQMFSRSLLKYSHFGAPDGIVVIGAARRFNRSSDFSAAVALGYRPPRPPKLSSNLWLLIEVRKCPTDWRISFSYALPISLCPPSPPLSPPLVRLVPFLSLLLLPHPLSHPLPHPHLLLSQSLPRHPTLCPAVCPTIHCPRCPSLCPSISPSLHTTVCSTFSPTLCPTFCLTPSSTCTSLLSASLSLSLSLSCSRAGTATCTCGLYCTVYYCNVLLRALIYLIALHCTVCIVLNFTIVLCTAKYRLHFKPAGSPTCASGLYYSTVTAPYCTIPHGHTALYCNDLFRCGLHCTTQYRLPFSSRAGAPPTHARCLCRTVLHCTVLPCTTLHCPVT